MLKRKELTEKEKELLDYIVDYESERGFQPSYRDMASYYACDLKTIADRLEAMEKKKVIKRTGHRGIEIRIIHDRGTPAFSRIVFQDNSEVSFKNTKITKRLSHVRKMEITLEASGLLNKWMSEFKQDKDIPIPVPVDLIVKDLFNYDIDRDFLEKEIPGKLFDKEKLIIVDTEDSPERQRFTIGHELAHLHLHAENGVTDGQIKELEADYFAASLLMPLKPFSQFVQKCLSEAPSAQSNDLIDRVSKRFDVSRDAAQKWLLEFYYLPFDSDKISPS